MFASKMGLLVVLGLAHVKNTEDFFGSFHTAQHHSAKGRSYRLLAAPSMIRLIGS